MSYDFEAGTHFQKLTVISRMGTVPFLFPFSFEDRQEVSTQWGIVTAVVAAVLFSEPLNLINGDVLSKIISIYHT